jgi:hypothetical protein
MPKVRWTRKHGIRILGPYRWDRDNHFICYVAPPDLLDVLTNQDFQLMEEDDFAAFEGIGREQAETFKLAGYATFADLIDAESTELAHTMDVPLEQALAWQEQARNLILTVE